MNPIDEINKYDKDLFKSDLEKGLVDTTNYQGDRERQLREEQMSIIDKLRKEELDRTIPYLRKHFFTPLDLINPDQTASQERTKKPLMYSAAFLVPLLLFAVMAGEFVTTIMNVPFLMYILVIFIIAIFGLILIWSKTYFNIDEEIKERSESGTGIKKSNIAEVWNINPNGIRERKIDRVMCTDVVYNSKPSIIIKLVRKSVLATMGDKAREHYLSMEKVEKTLVENGLCFTRATIKYDTTNDDIWEKLNENLEDASDLGKKYTDVMHDILQYQLEVTKEISTLNVLYYIIYPNIKIKNLTLDDAVRKINNILGSSRMELRDLNQVEFISILKNYYGIDIFIDNIMNSKSIDTDFQMKIDLIKFINKDGELISVRDMPTVKIPNYFQKEKPIVLEKVEEDKSIIFNNIDIYTNDVYIQQN